MTTPVVRDLTPRELSRLPEVQQEMADVGNRGVATRFTFFAAFDGTNNDRANLKLSGDEFSTNIGQLDVQAGQAAESNPNIRTRYYPGVGTGGDQGGLSTAAVFPTSAVMQQLKRHTRTSVEPPWTTSRSQAPPLPTSAPPPPASAGVAPPPSVSPSWSTNAG